MMVRLKFQTIKEKECRKRERERQGQFEKQFGLQQEQFGAQREQFGKTFGLQEAGQRQAAEQFAKQYGLTQEQFAFSKRQADIEQANKERQFSLAEKDFARQMDEQEFNKLISAISIPDFGPKVGILRSFIDNPNVPMGMKVASAEFLNGLNATRPQDLQLLRQSNQAGISAIGYNPPQVQVLSAPQRDYSNRGR